MEANTTVILLSIAFLIALIAAYISFLMTLQNTMKAISFENREMSPGAVWRMFIPLYNFFFVFIMVQKIADSITNHLEASGEMVPESKPTLNLGLIWAIFILGNLICSVLALKDLSTFTSLGTILFFVLYWRKVVIYKRQIEQHPEITLDIEKDLK